MGGADLAAATLCDVWEGQSPPFADTTTIDLYQIHWQRFRSPHRRDTSPLARWCSRERVRLRLLHPTWKHGRSPSPRHPSIQERWPIIVDTASAILLGRRPRSRTGNRSLFGIRTGRLLVLSRLRFRRLSSGASSSDKPEAADIAPE